MFGVTERRAQALVRTAQERFTEYADNAPRISPDVELTVAEGGDAGLPSPTTSRRTSALR